MTWWQIVLMCLGAIAVGGMASLLVIWIIARFSRKRKTGSANESITNKAGSSVTKGNKESANAITPLLNGRSILVLSLGLLVGIGLAVLYWATIPTINAFIADTRGGSLAPVVLGSKVSSYESTVKIQLINPGSSPTTLKELQYNGEYYAAKANTLPFWKYLIQELAKKNPQHSYTVDQIIQMTQIRYDYKGNFPALEVKVTASSEEDARFLVSLIPSIFVQFLVEEEEQLQNETRQATLKDTEDTSLALDTAKEELEAMELQAANNDITNDPDYLSLNATVEALRLELNLQASNLANLTALGISDQEYDDTMTVLNRTALALSGAQNKLAKLNSSMTNLADSMDYRNLTDRINTLNTELINLNVQLNASSSDGNYSRITNYLAMGNPTIPTPVAPERVRLQNAIMFGAVLGLIITWLGLNRRWLVKHIFSAGSTATIEEDDEA